MEVVASNRHYLQVKEGVQQDNKQPKFKYYSLEGDGIILSRNKFYVPNSHTLGNLVLKYMHNVSYIGHPRYYKIIAIVRGQYYWHGMKKDATDFVVRYMECQKVKVEHRHLT